ALAEAGFYYKGVSDHVQCFHCYVCMDNSAHMVYIPCGHMVTCVWCTLQLSNCPMCRKRITHT
ncbi:baculoviral IAP repeat-containing protein 7-like, partial [Penaeus chinensis]|uniref:baculoviral IAP repeat-containing protein 7-like n=1 Tax=Penaeus chinensis TaxID=139456 RepID=UPI001FB82ADA